MASSLTRAQIVTTALQMAGRGQELASLCNTLLNNMLRSWSLDFKYPSLRKVGSSITLAMGSTTAALPADLGAGMEKDGLIFSDSVTPLDEKSDGEFATLGGYPPANNSTGRPFFYVVDKEAGVFRFNVAADQAYTFTPRYFKLAPVIDVTATGDPTTVWVDNDELVIEALIQKIYQFKEDAREMAQYQKIYGNPSVPGMLGLWQRQVVTMGGVSRVRASSARFKKVTFP